MNKTSEKDLNGEKMLIYIYNDLRPNRMQKNIYKFQ